LLTTTKSLAVVAMADLPQLKVDIDALGELIKQLKTAASVDKDAVGKAVADLLAKKELYAKENNGIGVDGKPFEEPLTKAQKKAKAKAEKDAASAGAGAGNDASPAEATTPTTAEVSGMRKLFMDEKNLLLLLATNNNDAYFHAYALLTPCRLEKKRRKVHRKKPQRKPRNQP
jgi:hypothetical protein